MAQLFYPSLEKPRIGLLDSISDLTQEWNKKDLLILQAQRHPRYLVGFACSDQFLEQSFRLRYEVFNLEMREGLAASHLTGLDQDEFDPQMTHLTLFDQETARIAGTYRLQTARRGVQGRGLYSAQEFDLIGLESRFANAVECGRACIAPDHRSLITLRLLWFGIASFMKLHACDLLFGCCSIRSNDPDDGWRAMRTLRRLNYLHPELSLSAKPRYSCGAPTREADPALGDAPPLPTLFKAYVRQGARVISEPALDCEFGTVDFLVMTELGKVDF